MTDPMDMGDALRGFTAELDAAVVKARRVAAQARETSAKFRRETRQLAESVKAGTTRATADQLTDDRLRRTAAGFRTDNGLPVQDLPAGGELLAPPPAPVPHTTPGPVRATGSGRRIPLPSDDDEDFSQERIMW
ncbi:MAG TPA: hypothetical protein VH352_00365 [Pseudonocardiaceae bacterium]|nr:hypothetical protein [Pseudonocardiaceae bacterium]